MKKNIILIISLFILLIPSNIKATECSEQIKEEASKVSASYDVVKNRVDGVTSYNYKITITGLTDNLIVKTDLCNERDEVFSGKYNTTLLYPNEAKCDLVLEVFGNGKVCDEKLLSTNEVHLPLLNIYYNSNICKKNSDYKYCKKFIEEDILLDEVKEKLEALAKKDANNGEIVEVTTNLEKDVNVSNILIFVACGLFVLLITILIICIVTYKKKIKN